MIECDIKIEGLKRRLLGITPQKDQEAIERGISKATLLVQSEAKALVPVRNGELRGSIYTDVSRNGNVITGTVYTNKAYAMYVEFGTGPVGASDHRGISPNVNPAYTMSAWWIHEGPGDNEVDRETGMLYGWPYIDTEEGRFYRCSGNPAYPFMYPALHDNLDTCKEIVINELKNA